MNASGTDSSKSCAASRRRWWKEPPAYCGEIETRRLLGPIKLVWVGNRRYIEIRPLGVFRRV